MPTEMSPLPSIIEFHINNHCSGACVICSKAHGGHHQHFTDYDVILTSIGRLLDTKKKDYILQLGGDGDAFLHPHFLDYLWMFKQHVSHARRCLYTSGFSLTPKMTDQIEAEGLLDEVQIRIDSLDGKTYRQSTGMFLPRVMDNIKYFAAHNTHARLCVNYFPLYRYAPLCREKLGKEPTYFGRVDEWRLKDEWAVVQQYFAALPSKRPITVQLSGISLWAERTDCEWSDYPCPRLPENDPGTFSKQLYIYPNGDCGACGYDDNQDTFILGNVFEHSIREVWNGPKMQEYMDAVRNRTQENHPACCANALCCEMFND